MKRVFNSVRTSFKIINNNRGDIGLKQIAVTIGAIVIIGAFVSYVSQESVFSVWIDEIWTFAWDKIKSMT